MRRGSAVHVFRNRRTWGQSFPQICQSMPICSRSRAHPVYQRLGQRKTFCFAITLAAAKLEGASASVFDERRTAARAAIRKRVIYATGVGKWSRIVLIIIAAVLQGGRAGPTPSVSATDRSGNVSAKLSCLFVADIDQVWAFDDYGAFAEAQAAYIFDRLGSMQEQYLRLDRS